jgi:LmbE family N-acetylglucosaminyl deacetylase
MKILGIFAHPDDEIIFGWPIFQQKAIHKHLLCMTGIKERLCCLNKISALLDFSWTCPQLTDGNLVNVPNLVSDAIQSAIKEFQPELIFCHNSEGEYGHPDHKTIFNVVRKGVFPNVLISDIIVPVKSSKWELITSITDLSYYQNEVSHIHRNDTLYETSRRIYKDGGYWTWKNYPVPTSSSLYALRNEIPLEKIKECIIEA